MFWGGERDLRQEPEAPTPPLWPSEVLVFGGIPLLPGPKGTQVSGAGLLGGLGVRQHTSE